jgi:hypothetical protein
MISILFSYALGGGTFDKAKPESGISSPFKALDQDTIKKLSPQNQARANNGWMAKCKFSLAFCCWTGGKVADNPNSKTCEINPSPKIHCHGTVIEPGEPIEVAMYTMNYVWNNDHLKKRDYHGSLPGAFECDCAENMPWVQRSDCSQMTGDAKKELRAKGTIDSANGGNFNNGEGNDLYNTFKKIYGQAPLNPDNCVARPPPPTAVAPPPPPAAPLEQQLKPHAPADASQPALQDDIFEFNPPSIKFTDTELDASFQFRLKKRPAGSQLVAYFGVKGLVLEKCAFQFKAADYDKWQTIKFRPIPALKEQNVAELSISAKLGSDASPTSFVSERALSVIRTPVLGGTFSSTGDPHYLTFAGDKYDLQGVGEYILYKSTHFEIQSLSFPFGQTQTTVNVAVALRYGSTVLVLDVRTLTLPDAIQIASGNNDGLVISSACVSGSNCKHDIKLPGGSTVTFNAVLSNPTGRYIDISGIVDSSFGANGGLANKLGGPKGQFFLRDGTTGQGAAFFDSWKVKPEESLFNGKYVATNPTRKGVYDTCEVPAQPSFPKPKPPVVYHFKKFVPAAIIIPAFEKAKAVPSNPEFAKQAAAHCGSLFNCKGCNRIVDPKPYVASCIADALSCGNHGFSEGHKNAYLTACNNIVQIMAKDVKPVQEEALAIAATDGVTVSTACPNNCSGKGTCTSAACACAPGFGGIDCSTNLGSFLAYDTTKSKFVPADEAALPASSKPNYLTSKGPSSKPNGFNYDGSSEAALPGSAPQSTEILASNAQHIFSLVIYWSLSLF